MSYRTYAALLSVAGAVMLAVGGVFWRGQFAADHAAIAVMAVAGTALTLAFPLKVSPQAAASLAVAPLFAASLLLSPFQAALAGVIGSLAADLALRRRPLVMSFNAGVVAIAVTGASAAFHAIAPSGGASLVQPVTLASAILAGVMLLSVNMGAMAGLVSLKKGIRFWSVWQKTWTLDWVQEGGALALGYLAAVLVMLAWWTVLLAVVPLALVYLALSRSVQEAKKNIELAKQLKAQMEEMRATEAQLIQSAKMASVGTLAAGVAHELNNPLFAILGRVELLMLHPELHLASDRARDYMRSIYEMAQRASTIVQELLAFSRTNTTPEPVKVASIMDSALDLVEKDISRRGIHIRKEYDATPLVIGLPNRLQQVFLNLLLNARDATPDGGAILVRCWTQDGHVAVSIKDNGAGIPAEARSRLFEPFFTTKEVGKGTGLGLYVCHRIVAEHHGRIRVDSQEGKGTEVVVELPCEKERVTA